MRSSKYEIHEYIQLGGLLISILAMPFSISICHFGVIILVANWFAQGEWSQKFEQLKQNTSALIFVAFFCLVLLGTIYSDDVENAWFNVEKKLVFAVIPIILATTPLINKYKAILLRAFAVACVAATGVCLGVATYQSITSPGILELNFGAVQPPLLLANPLLTNQWQHFSYVALSSPIGIHPTYFSVYLIFCIAILSLQSKNAIFSREISITLTIYFLLFLALLSTRITLLVILAIVLIGAFYLLKGISKMRLKHLQVGAICLLLFFSLSALNPISFYREFQEVNSSSFRIRDNRLYSNSTEVRLSLWWTGIRTASVINPLVGSGTGDTQDEMKEMLYKHQISNVLNTSDPHNQFIYTYISLGAFGLVVLLCCYLLPIRHWRDRDILHLSFVGLILLVSFTESFLESQKGIMFFVLFQSILTFRKSNDVKFSKALAQ